MARHQQYPSRPRSIASMTDAGDLRAVITAALRAAPLDQGALRQAVWTYVGAEHEAGISPGRVILALTELIERAPVAPEELRERLTRMVILWCVEAYFGHLGGDALRAAADVADAPPPIAARQ